MYPIFSINYLFKHKCLLREGFFCKAIFDDKLGSAFKVNS